MNTEVGTYFPIIELQVCHPVWGKKNRIQTVIRLSLISYRPNKIGQCLRICPWNYMAWIQIMALPLTNRELQGIHLNFKDLFLYP